MSSSRPRDRLASMAAAVLSALLLFVAGEPAGVGGVAWIALVPLLVVVLRERRRRWSWLYGLVFGFVYFGIHLSWIFLFGWMAWTALSLALALYFSAATLLAGILRRFPLAPVLVAGAWAGIELVRDRWPVGGYSWGTAGTTQGTVPGVRWVAGTIGVYGLTFLVVFVAALLADRIVSGRWALGSVALVAAALLVFVAVDVVKYGSPPPGRAQRILVVQGGVPRPPRSNQRDVILESHVRLTRRHFDGQDVIVWPEDAVGVGVRASADTVVSTRARTLDRPMLIGRSVLTGDGGFLNTIRSISADGTYEGRYTKRHPVPFGEYVPFPSWRRFVSTLDAEIPHDLRRGNVATVFDVDGTKIATPICFESVFPRDILDFIRAGAELYVLETNNASFEHSYASEQHLAHTRMRALETRQWFVQSALAGISAEVKPDGTVEHTTKLFESAAFEADVRARPAHSLYARTGDLFPILFALGTGVALALWLFTLVAGRANRREEILSP